MLRRESIGGGIGNLATPAAVLPPRSEFVVETYSHHLEVTIVGSDYIAGEHGGRDRRNDKAPVIQPNKIVLGSHRPSSRKSPLDPETGCPASIAVAGGRREWNAGYGNRGIARPDPSGAAFAIHEYTVERITEAAGHGGQPAIVDSD